MGNWDADFTQGFICGVLPRNRHRVGCPLGIVTADELEGTIGLVGLVEELGFVGPALEHRERGTEIGESPLHDDFLIPVELPFARLGCGFDENGTFLAVESESQNAAAATSIGLVDGVVRNALRGAWGGTDG